MTSPLTYFVDKKNDHNTQRLINTIIPLPRYPNIIHHTNLPITHKPTMMFDKS